MNVSSIKYNVSFGAKLEMSENYKKGLYSKSSLNKIPSYSQKDIDKAIRKIEDFPADDTYSLQNAFDINGILLTRGSAIKKVSRINILYKNGERLDSFPSSEVRFIRCLADSFKIREKYPNAFKKLNMNEPDIIRMYNEIPKADKDELEEALRSIEDSKSKKNYSISSKRVNANIYDCRQYILSDDKGKIIKKKKCAMADFIIYVAKRYFKK